jgi:DNA sulfur modification protein DndD
MKIKEIELNNFRIYKGINTINLLPENEKNMIIISGKNGYGKTTFLMSLVWCLYGRLMQQVDKLYADEIASQGNYQTYISNSINRLAKAEGENKFSVAVTFIDVNLPIEIPTKEIKIIRSFDSHTQDEDIVMLINGAESEITKKYGYDKFITDFILPREIAKFFFFDAEKIVSLAEVHTSTQKKDLSKAYSEVLGIKKYEDLKNQIKELLNNLKKESATTEERIKLNDLKQQIENNKLILENNANEIEELTEEINLNAFQIDQIQSKLLRYGHTISDSEFEEMKKTRTIAESKIKELKDELSKLYDYVPFGIAGNKVMEVANQLQLEKEYKEKKYKIDNIEQKTEKIINKLNELRERETNKAGNELVIPVKTQEFYNSAIRELIM